MQCDSECVFICVCVCSHFLYLHKSAVLMMGVCSIGLFLTVTLFLLLFEVGHVKFRGQFAGVGSPIHHAGLRD